MIIVDILRPYILVMGTLRGLRMVFTAARFLICKPRTFQAHVRGYRVAFTIVLIPSLFSL
jgi:hypothetical protein